MKVRVGSWVLVTEPDEALRAVVRRPVYHDFEGTVLRKNEGGTFDVEDEFEQVFDSVPAANVYPACRNCNHVLTGTTCENCGVENEED